MSDGSYLTEWNTDMDVNDEAKFVPGSYMSNTGSGSGFGGAFSKNFGESFLDMWKNRDKGGSGTDNSKNYFGSTKMGGGSLSPIGSGGKHFLYQYTHPQATIMPSAPSQPGFGAQLGQAAAGAAVGAAVKALPFFCDERLKVDIAPLESTEVNDALAEVAFFVKGLRECA